MNIYFLKTVEPAGSTWDAIFDQVIVAESEEQARQLCEHFCEGHERIESRCAAHPERMPESREEWRTCITIQVKPERNIWLIPEETTCELLGKATENQEARFITGDWRSE